MRRLLTGYVIAFNHRHRRPCQSSLTGQAWATISEPIQIHCLSRRCLSSQIGAVYPLKSYSRRNCAGIVKTLDELKSYKYCGHISLMGNIKRQWQDTDYVLGFFGKRKPQARKEYEAFVKKGFTQDRRKELTHGVLIRSLGGWIQARERLKGRDHMMSDERILGDLDFLYSVISRSDDQYERRHKLKRRGYDMDPGRIER
jgi:hypothetical protein